MTISGKVLTFSFLAAWTLSPGLLLDIRPGPARPRDDGRSGPVGMRTGIVQARAAEGSGILDLLGIAPSPESLDYVAGKTQFQLHTLLTEQRHPATWNLSEAVAADTLAGLRMLAEVDRDIMARLEALASDTTLLEQAAHAVATALREDRRVYVYGCGATGRLAKQMESAFWRPFWRRVMADRALRKKLSGRVPDRVEDLLVGEMTGADRALISSLEGFEDLQLIGRLQLEDHGVGKGDVVICVTEGGETSSVIGAILRAHEQWKLSADYSPEESRRRLYFVYNNPDERLLPFERSRRILEEPGITKINLTTGPQAITGSTRMQATTIETYVVASVLEEGVRQALAAWLSPAELARLGFPAASSMASRLLAFRRVLDAVTAALPDLAVLTELETDTYARGGFSTYFAARGLITVFIDSTERSPTFRLFPLDTVREPARKCWIQVWTAARNGAEAWRAFLGRPFRGLDPALYRQPFATQVEDPYLRKAALESLTRAGNDQQDLYDFSFSRFNLEKRGPRPGDLGVAVCLSPEEQELVDQRSCFGRFLSLFSREGARLGVVLVLRRPAGRVKDIVGALRAAYAKGSRRPVVVPMTLDAPAEPFDISLQVAAKMLINTHSTAVMAKLGKVIGNTMTNVSPSNLKLIGRATFLVQSHINDVISGRRWREVHGETAPVTYAEANAVLFDAIAFLKDRQAEAGQTAEVAFSIIRALESLRRKSAVSREETLGVVKRTGLAAYLRVLR